MHTDRTVVGLFDDSRLSRSLSGSESRIFIGRVRFLARPIGIPSKIGNVRFIVAAVRKLQSDLKKNLFVHLKIA